MTNMTELEDRLRAALSRIEDAAAAVPDPRAKAQAEEEVSGLRAQLEEEQSTNAQLIERVTALKERQENQVADLEQALKASRQSEAEKTAVQQQLKDRVEELRDQVARLHEANRAMVGDPNLVNTAMMAELEAMRASRRADVTEIDEIVAHLNPHLEGEAHG